MFMWSSCTGLFIFTCGHLILISNAQNDPMICIQQQQSNVCAPKVRRYDISDMGYENLFHGWVDVQGQRAANDYCRFVGTSPNVFLSCALAGTHGISETSYTSSKSDFDAGHPKTWYMKDEDGDGRDDYCRCLGPQDQDSHIVCTKAGPIGFYGSREQGGQTHTFIITGTSGCWNRTVRPEFGRKSQHD